MRADRVGGKDLRVSHDVLFDSLGGLDVGEGEAQEEREAIAGEQRGAEAIGGSVRAFVSSEFRRVPDAGEVGIGKDEVLGFRILGCEKSVRLTLLFLAEVIEGGISAEAVA